MHSTSTLVKHVIEILLPLYHTSDIALPIAWWILELATGLPTVQLLAQKTITLTSDQEKALSCILEKHVKQHMPLQYIAGSVPFLDLTITVRPPLLIPRPETEYWCSGIIQCLRHLKDQELTILDLCTGTGCIALALAHALPKAYVYGVDLSHEACILANENKEKNKIENITVVQSDLYNALPSDLTFDLIVSNPPYISKREWEQLDPMVKEWEDPQALLAPDNGLGIIKAIIQEAHRWLKKDSKLIVHGIAQIGIEIGYEQGFAVKGIFEDNGFKRICIEKDPFGKDRFVSASL